MKGKKYQTLWSQEERDLLKKCMLERGNTKKYQVIQDVAKTINRTAKAVHAEYYSHREFYIPSGNESVKHINVQSGITIHITNGQFNMNTGIITGSFKIERI